MSVLNTIMGELVERKAYMASVYAPYYIYSYAIHAFNLHNQRNRIYWEGGQLPNMRLSIMFVAPSGFMKTYYLRQMADKTSGIFTGTKIKFGRMQELSAAGLVGTFKQTSLGDTVEHEGAAKIYKEHIVTVDEFSGITNAFASTYNNQMDSQLLAILDSGEVYKRLGSGDIEYTSYMSLWAGVQPARYDLRSGMGRRMIFLLFIPSKHDNKELIRAQQAAQNIAPSTTRMTHIWKEVDQWVDNINRIERIEFDDSLTELYLSMDDVFSFEVSYFNRLALGYELATNGPRRCVVVDAHDKALVAIIEQQKQWRNEIMRGVEHTQMIKLINMGGVSDKEGNIIITRNKLITDATMVGWNAHQVGEQLLTLVRDGVVKVKGQNIILESNYG